MVKPLGWLAASTFETVVASTPLVAIDFLVKNERGEYLLGLRRNRPAQNYWFVPGGRVQKDESLEAAFKRLTCVELGVELARGSSVFKGVYEHFYQDSIFGQEISTHYVVLAHQLILKSDLIQLDTNQHSTWAWVEPRSMGRLNVHRHTLDYFSLEGK